MFARFLNASTAILLMLFSVFAGVFTYDAFNSPVLGLIAFILVYKFCSVVSDVISAYVSWWPKGLPRFGLSDVIGNPFS